MTNAGLDRDTLATFQARAAEARSIVHTLGDWRAVAVLAARLAGAGRVAISGPAAAVAPTLLEDLQDRSIPPGADHVTVAGCAVGLVRGAFAVAETGSVVLVEERAEDRAVSMLAPIVIQVVDRADVLPRLEALLERVLLAPGGPPVFASVTTGPSRTADIERSLTIGVHGPHEVHVVVLG